jgi:hypothetical protein
LIGNRIVAASVEWHQRLPFTYWFTCTAFATMHEHYVQRRSRWPGCTCDGSQMIADVTLRWFWINNPDNDLLYERGALYCYSDAAEDDCPLYIGKADRSTVYERWCCHKWDDDVREHIREVLGVRTTRRRVGLFETELKLTSQLIEDVESLLIWKIRPPANVRNRDKREIWRPGLVVVCRGDWPWETHFKDDRKRRIAVT